MNAQVAYAIAFLLIFPYLNASPTTEKKSVLQKSLLATKSTSRTPPTSPRALFDQIDFSQLTSEARIRVDTVSREGLTGEPCSSDDDCDDSRECTNDFFESCTGTSCVCSPSPPQLCKESTECDTGEVCASTEEGGPVAVCISESIVEISSNITEVDTTSTTTGSGLTWDPCSTTAECEGVRKCELLVDEDIVECDNDQDEECHCFPEILTKCSTNEDCEEDGEICAEKTNTDTELLLCISEEAEANLSFYEAVGPQRSPEPPSPMPPSPMPPSPTPQPTSPTGSGLTWDPCSTTAECEGVRKCELVVDGDVVECDNDQDEECHCFPKNLTPCATNEDCKEDGEICAVKTDIEPKQPLCISEEAEANLSFFEAAKPPQSSSGPPTPLPSREPEECVDVRTLKHLSPDELVYSNHAFAKVLCDPNDSCATPAHIVVFNRRPMMMRTYCEIVRCVEKETLVNSPKYRRALVLETGTQGLHFTAFSARYGTYLEEAVIAAALRMGF